MKFRFDMISHGKSGFIPKYSVVKMSEKHILIFIESRDGGPIPQDIVDELTTDTTTRRIIIHREDKYFKQAAEAAIKERGMLIYYYQRCPDYELFKNTMEARINLLQKDVVILEGTL